MSNSLSDGLHDSQPQKANVSGGQHDSGFDDDDVVLKSFRGVKKHQRYGENGCSPRTSNNNAKKDKLLNTGNSFTQIEESEGCEDNMIEDSPR